jgi:uncharacterized membrane protein YhaH (DUF805 family)
MLEWMLMPLKRYADFKGRSRRKEYWSFFLLNLIVSAVLLGPIYSVFISNAMTTATSDPGNFEAAAASGFQFADHPIATGLAAIGLLWTLFAIVPGIAVIVRRLHDRDMSGWWYLGFIVASIIPFVGFIGAIALLVLMCLEGTKGPNRFGDDPKGVNSGEVFS